MSGEEENINPEGSNTDNVLTVKDTNDESEDILIKSQEVTGNKWSLVSYLSIL